MKNLILMVSVALGVGVLTHGWSSPVMSSETVKGAQKDYETFKADMSKKLEALDKQIGELKEKAKTEASEKSTKELEAARDKLKAKLDSLSDDAQDGWEKMKAGIAKSMDTLNKKVQKALKN
jgi:DNA anti-recombination protein RmuC